jgi:hypothetical protein
VTVVARLLYGLVLGACAVVVAAGCSPESRSAAAGSYQFGLLGVMAEAL